MKAAATGAPAAILLDLGLPDMDGKEVIAEIRLWSKTPIIVLSARDRESEKIAALDLGADDYVNKPFGIGHAAQQAGETTRLQSGPLSVDIASHAVTLEGNPIKLCCPRYPWVTAAPSSSSAGAMPTVPRVPLVEVRDLNWYVAIGSQDICRHEADMRWGGFRWHARPQ